jgi:hypothetical protein
VRIYLQEKRHCTLFKKMENGSVMKSLTLLIKFNFKSIIKNLIVNNVYSLLLKILYLAETFFHAITARICRLVTFQMGQSLVTQFFMAVSLTLFTNPVRVASFAGEIIVACVLVFLVVT